MTTRVVALLYLSSIFLSQAISYGDIYLFHIMSIIAGVVLFFENGIFKNFILIHRTYYQMISIVLLWITATIFWNIDLRTTYRVIFQYYLSFSILFFAPFYLNLLEGQKIKSLMLSGIGIHIALSIVESLNIFRWPISPYSQYKELFLKDAVQDYGYNTIKDLTFAPPTSLFWNPNNSAYFTLLILPLTALLNNKLLRSTAALTCLILIFFSESKSLLVIAILYLLLLLMLAMKTNIKKLIPASFVIGMAFFYFFKDRITYLQKSYEVFLGYVQGFYILLKSHFSGVPFNDLAVHEKIRERLVLIDRALLHLDNFGITGKGVGYLSDKSFFYEDRYLYLSSVHNFLIELLLETGVIGLSLFTITFLFFIKNATKSRYKKVVISVLVLMIAGLPVMSSLRYFLPFYGILALIYYFSTSIPTNSNELVIGHDYEKESTNNWYHWSRWGLFN